MTRRNLKPAPQAGGDHGVETVVIATLGAVLALSIAAPALFAGRPKAWALPALDSLLGEAIWRGLLLTVALAGGLRLFQAFHEMRGPRWRTAGLTAALVLGLTALFSWIGPDAPIGDFQVLLRSVEFVRLVGKWYLASAAYIGFHHGLGAAVGFSVEQSVQMFSSLCGALTAFVVFLVVGELGLPRVLRAWPFLVASASAVTVAGLGHIEIYALVVLLAALFAWLGLRFVARGCALDGLLFCLVLGVGLATYLALWLLLPIAVAAGALAWPRHRPRGARSCGLIAAGLLLVAAPSALSFGLGPAPADFTMSQKLLHSVEPQAQRVVSLPNHLPVGVVWPTIRYLARPKFWFSEWRLVERTQLMLLSDRAGIALASSLAALALLRWRRRRPPAGGAAILFLGACAAPYAAFQFTAIHGLPLPWDWDLFSYVALFTNLFAAALLVGLAPPRGYGRVVSSLLVLVGLCAQVAGMHVLLSCARGPAEFGPPVAGLRLGVTPARVTLAKGRRVPVWWWLKNEGAGIITLRSPAALVEVGGVSRRRIVRAIIEEQQFPRTVVIRPGATVCFARVDFAPKSFETSPSSSNPDEIRWSPLTGATPDESFVGVWQVRFEKGRGGEPVLDMVSNQIEMRIADSFGILD